jgi:hypothetical protein
MTCKPPTAETNPRLIKKEKAMEHRRRTSVDDFDHAKPHCLTTSQRSVAEIAISRASSSPSLLGSFLKVLTSTLSPLFEKIFRGSS